MKLKHLLVLPIISLMTLVSSCSFLDDIIDDPTHTTPTEPETPETPEDPDPDTPSDPPASDLAHTTLLMYICGSNLESGTDDYGYTHPNDAGLATTDISEILSVAGQPEDINIVIETGGAKAWKSTYGISNSKLERWEVRNKKLNKVQSLTYANMGLQSTFQSFISWGLENYPAEKTAVILWNHGGAMGGVCADEKKNNDTLLNSEVDAALTDVLGTKKLEWIGYDACLMQVQDIAEFNSKHFKYMVAAQEAEVGTGWEYSSWIDDLYAKKETTKVLKAICDGFIQSVDDLYDSYGYGYSKADNDQTLSYLDLSYMSEYKTAFDTFTTKVKTKGISTLRTFMKSVKNYADETCDRNGYNEYINYYGYPTSWFTKYSNNSYLLHGYYFYGTFDVVDMLNKMAATDSIYSSYSTEITSLLNILSNLIGYFAGGQAAGNSSGLCVVVNMDYQNSFVTDEYKTSETNFNSWLNFVNQ